MSSQDSAHGTMHNPAMTNQPGAFLLTHSFRAACMTAGLFFVFAGGASAQLKQVEPQQVGLDATKLAAIDGIVETGLAEGKMPGCIVCIGRHASIGFLKAYGFKQVEGERVPMTLDTVFDMASITKPAATATSIMILAERGLLSISDPVTKYVPEFGSNGKEAITIRHLLVHNSGLLPDNALADYLDGPQLAIQRICELSLQNPVGEKFVYSDVNFITLGEIVRRVSGLSVNEFSRKEVFDKLGMRETGYLPASDLRARAAPTEQRNGEWMRGEVHDPRAYELGGVAGHAGLFSTVQDLAVYAQMMLNEGEYGGIRVLSPTTVRLMTSPNKVSSGVRGLGWDKQTGFSTNKGKKLTASAFGHGGFTGTVLWIDPELDLFYIFLSNRVHPNNQGLVNPLAGEISTIAAEAIVE